MKKVLLAAAMALLGTASYAQQYISPAPANGFDVNGGKDYVILYAPEDIVTRMGSKVIKNNNLDPNMERNQFYYWVTDWDKTELTLAPVVENGLKNSWGGDECLNITPLRDWGAGTFTAKTLSDAYDFSKVTDKHYIHIGLRDGGNATSVYKFQFGPLNEIDKSNNGFQLMVNIPVGASQGNFVGIGNVGHDKNWYSIDIPIADLIDENGDFGFTYDFSKPFIIKKGTTITENGKDVVLTEDKADAAFLMGFDKPTVSKCTFGPIPPGEKIKPVTITELNSAMTVDAVFFYIPVENGINDINVSNDNDNVEAVYDLSGRRVENPSNGVYIIKTAKGTKKVVLK